jgi:RNA polymerase sigma factor (sigma-70 family)
MLTPDHHALVLRHRPLALRVVAKLMRSSATVRRMGQDDAEAAAMLGLCRAVEKFDPARVGRHGKPVAFSTYAWLAVRRTVILESLTQAAAVTLPDPSVNRRMSPDTAEAARRALTCCVYLPEWAGDRLAARPEPDQAEQIDASERLAWVERRLRRMPAAWREVIRGRLEGQTLDECAVRISRTRSRAQQIERLVVEQLREKAEKARMRCP